ncbi:AAA family ATPase [Amnibacterium sp.]|uniref:ATP-binding protein n=1 Tax=Amnibacterium sp. TaxID=1872496 RepID=UPI002630792A|nr:AAA family ATPase [Amnibacterium sp.]MCU1472890.1 DNA-binding transcriptional activator of the family [Amnibacterium sp.]
MGDRTDLVDLRLFGTPRVLRDGRPVSFDTRKALALLAVIAESGIDHSRESLADMLWPELDGTRARAALRRTLSVTSAIGPCLISTPSTIGLDHGLLQCDVTEFRRLARANGTAELTRAADLAVDGFLAGFSLRDSAVFEDWQLATGDLLRDELSQLLARLVSRAVDDGRLPAALGFARRRVQIDPLSEPAHAGLIRVLAWSGDRPGALGAYRALVRLLDRELGVPPLPETLALHDDIRGDRLAAPERVPVSPRTPPPVARRIDALVGRDAELASLDAAWRRLARTGRAVGLVGDPGVGKTALVRRLAEHGAADGGAVVAISGHAAERGLAFVASADLVRRLLAAHPALADRLGAAGDPFAALAPIVDPQGDQVIRSPGDLRRLHEAVRDVLAEIGRDQRVLLVVDDAQLLDGPSSTLLGYVVRRLPPGVLVLATWSRGSGEAELPRAIAEVGEVIQVEPLGLDSVARLLGPRAPEAQEVLQRTRGLPLLVREYAAAVGALDEGRGVRDLVAARLDAAPELTRQLVGAAAVIATVADPELLRAACGRDEAETVDAIEDAIARGLLVERTDRPGYDVPHDLMRDLALTGLSLARRRLLHGRVADLLARRGTVDPIAAPAGVVARHLAGAGRDDEAGAWYLTAARASTRLAAHAEALQQLEAALALGHAPLEVREAMGTSLVRLGRYAEALVAFDQAVALAEGDTVRQRVIEHAIAGVHDRLGDWKLSRAHLHSALDLIPPGSQDRRARILADLALVEHRMGHPVEAGRLAEEAAEAATGDGDRAALAQAMNVLGVIEQAHRHWTVATDRLGRAVELAREIGDRDLEIAALNNLSHAASAAGDADAAARYAREALDRAEQQGDLHRLAALHSHMADLLHAAGREEEALAQFRTSASAFAEVQGAALRPEVWTLTEW